MSKSLLKVGKGCLMLYYAINNNNIGSDDESEYERIGENFIDIARPVSHAPAEESHFKVEPFPLVTAGAPLAGSDHGPSSFEVYQQSIGCNNNYAPFRSKLDWDIAQWAKMHGPSSSAISKLLGIEGVRQHLLSSQLWITLYYSSARRSAFHTITFMSSIKLSIRSYLADPASTPKTSQSVAKR